jgi:hypothetical protein
MATGLTNADLTRLIRAGVAEKYSVRCTTPSDFPPAARRLVWRVTAGGRQPRAVISVQSVQGGEIVKSAFITSAAPGANPDAVFIYAVARLTQRILPPATASPGSGHEDGRYWWRHDCP